jgi:probable HAF family extracellular repeat protein
MTETSRSRIAPALALGALLLYSACSPADVTEPRAAGRSLGTGTNLTVGAITDLGSLGGSPSIARSVNAQGVVAGVSYLANGTYHAFVWSITNGLVDIGTVPGDNSSQAFAINDNGEVVGPSHPASAGSGSAGSPAIWTPNGSGGYTVQSLGMSINATSYDLNNSGTVVGDFPDPVGNDQPYAWTPAGGRQTLPLLAGFYRGRATAISTPGTIVGWEVYQSSSGRHVVGGIDYDVTIPVVWPAAGGVTRLGLPSGYTYGEALGVNDFDVVVGFAWTSGKGTSLKQALRWRPDPQHPGAWLAPDALSGVSTSDGTARDVNNAGLIVGLSNGNGFVWSDAAGFQSLGGLTTKDGSDALRIDDPADGSRPEIVGKSGSHAVRWQLP